MLIFVLLILSRISKFASLEYGSLHIYSLCNLLLSFCRNYFICESRIVSSPNLILYLGCCFAKNLFFFRIKICILHASTDVTMVDKCLCSRLVQNTFFPREFSIANVT